MRFSLGRKILKTSFWIPLLLFFFSLHARQYCFEGIYRTPDGDERFFLVGQFLPYNPAVLAIQCNSDAFRECARWWPKGSFFTEQDLLSRGDEQYQFVWIGSEESELDTIKRYASIIKKASVIYTPTHFSDDGNRYEDLKFFLNLAGFTLLSHWYWEGEKGHAIFLKTEIFDAAMRTLNSKIPYFADFPSRFELERFFRKAGDKSDEHSFMCIDYVYMINLDQRPEKFAKAAGGLQLYGISPHRFSAVNGWELPYETIRQVGVRFTKGTLKDPFFGSIYHECDGALYRSNQIIKEDEGTYFSIGLSQGAIGIVLSHLSVLQDAYDSGYQVIWVMEDDVEAVGDPWQIPEMIRSLDVLDPDWDILFTDTDTKDVNGNHVPCRSLATRPNYSAETLDAFLGRFYSVSADLSRIGMRYGAYSMIVRRSGMEKILNYFKQYGVFLPYDMDFWLVPNLKMYSVNRDIVSHAAGSITDNNLPHYAQTNPKPLHRAPVDFVNRVDPICSDAESEREGRLGNNGANPILPNRTVHNIYCDEELEWLWGGIQDICNPTLEEYQKIDQYLVSGARPYLDRLRKANPANPDRLRSILALRLLGLNQEEPVFETHLFDTDESIKKRCIVLYASSNGIYQAKARKLLREIEECGYQGHVLLRIGGFPNTPFGGLKICHVPYSFKVAFLQEAKMLGYEQILWIDLAIHPLENFETVFREIRHTGWFFTNVGSLDDNRPTHLPQAAGNLGITTSLYNRIPHISSSMIGLNMKNTKAIQLLEQWYCETESVYPSLTWWPEELSLSVTAWRLGCTPSTYFGDFVCIESEQFQLENRPNVAFYLDGRR